MAKTLKKGTFDGVECILGVFLQGLSYKVIVCIFFSLFVKGYNSEFLNYCCLRSEFRIFSISGFYKHKHPNLTSRCRTAHLHFDKFGRVFLNVAKMQIGTCCF